MPRKNWPPKTRERKDVTLPIGLKDEVTAMLGGRGFSGLVTTLLLHWKKRMTAK